MEVLRTGISALSAYDPDAADNSKDATARKALRLTAQMPTLVAAWERIRRGKAPVAPNPRLNLAANFLYMMSGKKASPLAVKTFDVALILHADHEFNASTFAARVTAATMSDLHSSIVSAIGALKGPLHGGANEQVMLMVQKIKTPANADAFIRKLLADHGRVMGFGHRCTAWRTPREAPEAAGHRARQAGGDTSAVEILDTVVRSSASRRSSRTSTSTPAPPTSRWDSDRPVHADLRDEPGRRLGGARHGAAREQPADPSAREYTGPTHATYVPIDRR